MANLSIKNLAQIRAQYPIIGEALSDVQLGVNNGLSQVNATAVGQTPAPLGPAKLVVDGGGGFGRAHIFDNSPAYRGKEWFLEVVPATPDKSFNNPIKMHIGATPNYYFALPKGHYHLRAYSAQSTSSASDAVYAYDVDATGATPPAVQGNTPGGDGYGDQPYNTTLPPKRS